MCVIQHVYCTLYCKYIYHCKALWALVRTRTLEMLVIIIIIIIIITAALMKMEDSVSRCIGTTFIFNSGNPNWPLTLCLLPPCPLLSVLDRLLVPQRMTGQQPQAALPLHSSSSPTIRNKTQSLREEAFQTAIFSIDIQVSLYSFQIQILYCP